MNRKNITAFLMAMSLGAVCVTGGCGTSSDGSAETTAEELSADTEAGSSDEEAAFPVTAEDTDEGKACEKSELVKVTAAMDGSPQELTVETILKRKNDTDRLLDFSSLGSIKNTEGDEEYVHLEDGTLVWENHGEDITYESTWDESTDGPLTSVLPVQVRISYTLDGVSSTYEEMKGKSGDVTIRFEYENQEKTDGAPVPFAAISAVMLDEEVFSDVEVTNGSLLSMGDTQAAVGLAFPGLDEYLDLQSVEGLDDMEPIPDYVEISAHAEAFTLDFTATFISSGLLEELEEEDLEDADDLTEDAGDLQEASDKILDGIGELGDGARTMSDYLDQYVDGVKQAASGTGSLSDGLAAINRNKSSLAQGAKALSDGLDQLDTTLASYSGSMDTSALTDAMTGIGTDLYRLNAILSGMDSAVAAWQDYVKESASWQQIVQSKIESAKETLESIDLSAATAGLDEEQKQAVENAVAAAVSSAKQTLEAALDEAAPSVPETEITEEGLSSIITDLQTHMQTVSSAGESLSGIGDAVNSMQSAVSALAEGSAQLSAGISSLNTGLEQLSSGAGTLDTGMSTLSNSGSALNKGMNSLKEGIEALQDGYEEFDEEGIRKLADFAGNDMKTILDKVKNLKQADDRYDNFAGKITGQKSSTTFLIQTQPEEE